MLSEWAAFVEDGGCCFVSFWEQKCESVCMIVQCSVIGLGCFGLCFNRLAVMLSLPYAFTAHGYPQRYPLFSIKFTNSCSPE